MYKLTLTFTFLLIFFKSNAQLNYKKVDSISFALYQQKKWKNLTDFAKNPSVSPYDFYFLNLRFGIAFYQLKDYQKANIYFKRAIKNNSSSQVALEYLFWTNLFLKNEKKAQNYYQKLDKNRRDKINYSPKKFFDFIYFEGGKNLQENSNSKDGDITYFNIGLHHYITNNIVLYHSYFYQQQALEFSKYTLQRYYFNPTFLLKNNFELGLYGNLNLLNNTINYKKTTQYSFTEQNVTINGVLYDKVTNGTENYSYIGTQNENEILVGAFISKLFKKLKIVMSFSVSTKKTKTNVVEKKEGTENIVYLLQGNEVSNDNFPFSNENIIQKDSISTKFNAGFAVGYQISKKLGAQLNTNIISFNNQIDINYIPSISYKISDKINITANFIQKGYNEYYYYNGLYLISNLGNTQRFGVVSDISLTKNIDLYFIYQKDIIQNISKSNTFITGLKLKL